MFDKRLFFLHNFIDMNRKNEKLNFDYVEKAREIYTLFLGEDCYDDVAQEMYGGFQKLDISKI